VTFTADQRVLLAEARRATLATIGDDGRPRLVPICFVVVDDVVWSPLDEKPKAVRDVRDLARVRDIMARPDVSLLVDRWSEDWSELAWMRIGGRARLVEPEAVPPAVIAALRAKHPQYRDHDLEHRPALRIEVANMVGWSAHRG
jgi:PPOX class probable F420-dependent enzyme